MFGSANSSTPVTVVNLTGVLAVVAADSQSCAIESDRTVSCWGNNASGALGNGTTTDSSVPVPVALLTDVQELSAQGSTICARLADATVQCWGFNNSGQVGDGTTSNRSSPRVAMGLSGVKQLSTGTAHSCALKTDGTVWCWGSNATNGQLGDSTYAGKHAPVAVPGITNAIDLSLGEIHSCAVLADLTVTCWGYDGHGELGDGVTTPRAPVAPLLTCAEAGE